MLDLYSSTSHVHANFLERRENVFGLPHTVSIPFFPLVFMLWSEASLQKTKVGTEHLKSCVTLNCSDRINIP